MKPTDDKIFRECEVLSVLDDKGGMRIKVRLDPEDNHLKKLSELPYCYPLMPRHFHIAPKLGEFVLVITSRLGDAQGRRWFIGPIISQQYALNEDPYLSAHSVLDNGRIVVPLPLPELNPDNRGSYPDREDIAIQGRQNADLILKENEVRLRCGFKQKPNGNPTESLLFNKEDLSYIQMKYKRLIDHNNQDFSSAINIVADRINLLSHDSRTPFTLNDPKDLITDQELLRILENAHPLPYGDELIEFLKRLVEVIRTHTHPFAMDPPCFTTPQIDVLNTNLDEMLSNSIRIN
jgi:hypothetical protein